MLWYMYIVPNCNRTPLSIQATPYCIQSFDVMNNNDSTFPSFFIRLLLHSPGCSCIRVLVLEHCFKALYSYIVDSKTFYIYNHHGERSSEVIPKSGHSHCVTYLESMGINLSQTERHNKRPTKF